MGCHSGEHSDMQSATSRELFAERALDASVVADLLGKWTLKMDAN